MEKTKSYCLAQYVLFNTLGMGRYPGSIGFPYLNQVDGADLHVSLLPSINDIGTNRFVSRAGACANAFNYVAGSPECRAAASYNANPGVVPISGTMTHPNIDALPRVGPSRDAPEVQPKSRDIRIFIKPICNQTLGIRSNLGRITRTPKGLEHRELRHGEVSGCDFNFPELHSLFCDGHP